jgi:diguanylate cyclase (GGDEF)-like protein
MLNLKAFILLARGELERARRNQAPFSLVVLTIQNLNEISEKYGEEIARDVLVLFTQAIREKSRPYDNVGRMEQSKILIPLPFVIGQDAEKVAVRLLKGITNTNFSLLDGTVIEVRTGIGVISATRVTTATEIETMLEKAKEVLAHLKQDRVNQMETLFI